MRLNFLQNKPNLHLFIGAVMGVILFSLDGLAVTSTIAGVIYGVIAVQVLVWCSQDIKHSLFHMMVLGAVFGAILGLITDGEIKTIIAGITGYSYLFPLFVISARETIWGILFFFVAILIGQLIMPNILLLMIVGAMSGIILREKIFSLKMAHHSAIAGCFGSLYGALIALSLPTVIAFSMNQVLMIIPYTILTGALIGAIVGACLRMLNLYLSYFNVIDK